MLKTPTPLCYQKITRVRTALLPSACTLPQRPEPGDDRRVESEESVTTEDETPVGTADAATPVRVLVADDSPAFLRAAVAVVAAAEGFELVGVARSGEDAVAVAEAVAPDLVLLDIRMPGVGGVEAARRIHASNERAVVVMITAGAGWGLSADAMRGGASAAVKKQDVLPGTLRDLWQRHAPSGRS